MNYTIEKAKEENRTDIFRLLKQANMHYIPSEEMPGLTYENYFVAKNDGNVLGFCGYKILSEHDAKTELMVVDKQTRESSWSKNALEKFYVVMISFKRHNVRYNELYLPKTQLNIMCIITWISRTFCS